MNLLFESRREKLQTFSVDLSGSVSLPQSLGTYVSLWESCPLFPMRQWGMTSPPGDDDNNFPSSHPPIPFVCDATADHKCSPASVLAQNHFFWCCCKRNRVESWLLSKVRDPLLFQDSFSMCSNGMCFISVASVETVKTCRGNGWSCSPLCRLDPVRLVYRVINGSY